MNNDIYIASYNICMATQKENYMIVKGANDMETKVDGNMTLQRMQKWHKIMRKKCR